MRDWMYVHVANMYQRVTSVALYDTLGVESIKFCINQTEMITIAGTIDMLTKLCDLKREEAQEGGNMLSRLKFFIVMGMK